MKLRKLPHPVINDEVEWEAYAEEIGICEPNQANDALEEVNKLLQKFGLEVVEIDSRSSDMWFDIVKLDVSQTDSTMPGSV